jgi:metal-responsive CopG/Arc/MetJ family transcriptional regulator
MNNYPNILSVKMNDETMDLMDEVCAVEEQSRSGLTRKAIKSYLRSPRVMKSLRGNEPVDFMYR